MRKLSFLLPILALTLLTGCYRIRYDLGPIAQEKLAYTDTRWQNYFFLGFIPSNSEYRLVEMCHSDELAAVSSYRSPVNVLQSILALGISSSSTVEVTCNRRGS